MNRRLTHDHTGACRSEHATSSGGYVLFLVVIVVALLAIVLVTTARVQSSLQHPLRALREAAAEDVVTQSVTARMAFVLLTEPIGARAIVVGGARTGATMGATTGAVIGAGSGATGPRPRATGGLQGFASATGGDLAEVRLDGRPYGAPTQMRVREAVFVSVQDEDGLLSLNAGDDPALAGLIEGVGVARQTARALAAALNDYVDEDDLARPYGGEKDAYQRARRPAPPNTLLRAPWDAALAMGWDNALSDRQRAQIWALSSAPLNGKALNVNTAPRAVLEAVLADARMTRTLIARREQSELSTLDDVQAITGAQTRADGVVLATKPGSAFRVVVAFGPSPDAARRRVESQLQFADAGADRPIYWRNVRRAQAADGAWEGRDRGNGPERIPDSAALLAP